MLGNVNPDVYARHFTPVRDVYVQQRAFMERVFGRRMEATFEQLATIQTMRDTGVSEEAVNEKMQSFGFNLEEVDPELFEAGAKLDEQIAAAHRAEGVRLALVIALAVIMVLEAVLGDMSPQRVRALSFARYALLAVWLAMLIAQPALLRELPGVFALLLIVVAVGAAFVPMGKRQPTATGTAS